MYLSYYDFRKPPFHITPDPEFFFMSPGHREALASLIYGVENRKGLISLTGEVGTGKTTVVHAFLQAVTSSSLTPLHLSTPKVAFRKLVQLLIRRLDGPSELFEMDALMDRLNQLLEKAHEQKRIVALILDEAQNIPMETLGQLHLLSNLENEKEKRLQILLIGQPELDVKLQSPRLRQLRQRIAIRTRVPLLTALESREYIRHRLMTAAGRPVMPFAPAALRKIIAAAKGSPRVLNILCDNALIAGFGCQRKRIPVRVVREVLADFRDASGSPVSPFSLAFSVGSLAIVAAVLVPLLVQGTTPSAPIRPKSEPLAFSGWMSPAKLGGDPAAAALPPTPAEGTSPNRMADGVTASPALLSSLPKPAAAPAAAPPAASKAETGAGGAPRFPVIRVVREGECLSRLCAEIYGKEYSNNRSVIERLKAANANLTNVNRLSIGDRIVFPKLSITENGHDPNL
jgi:general secretion pathway protein A